MNFILSIILFLGFACANNSGTPIEEPELRITDLEVVEGNNANTILFTVELRGANPGNVSVAYRTVDGTAKAGIDYEGVDNGLLSFGPNENQKILPSFC
ncbi:MAG: hypothetical protein HC880_10265 [Bacteroidia bacterium]|nr:hypothetical protein [Bacteroidia bacterium]